MKRLCFVLLALASAMSVPLNVRGQYASSVISYVPGSGVNSGFTNANAALGAPAASATPFAPAFSGSQIVSIGQGGSLALQLDTPINNAAHPYGIDFLIFGNSFFVLAGGNATGALGGNNPGSTRVEVSADGVTWYWLDPLRAPVVDGFFPTDGSGNPQTAADPRLTAASFAGQNLAGVRALYGGSAGGTGYDLAWAEDSQGNLVALPSAEFVRIEVLSGKSEIDAIAAVPEPNAWALIWAGAGWLCLRNRNGIKRGQIRSRGAVLAGLAASLCLGNLTVRAETLRQDFSTDPAQSGWQTFGEADLFHWDSGSQNLQVTWDSSLPNSGFYHSLGTILGRDDDFRLEFDLELDDIGPADSYEHSFELAVGLVNERDARSPGLLRGAGQCTNLVEIAYFWADDFGSPATVYPTCVDSNNNFNYNGVGAHDSTNYTLATHNWHHFAMSFNAADQLLVTSISNFTGMSTAVVTQQLNSFFLDYRLDAVSISSYNDAGQFPGYEGSIRAHGRIDNLLVVVPPSPVQNFAGKLANGQWQGQFLSRSNWLYTLERSTNLVVWTPAGPTMAGNASILSPVDIQPPADRSFYRVRAEKP